MSASQWYYVLNDQQVGPVSQEELESIIAARGLPGSTLVWSKQLTAWTAAKDTDQFRKSFQAVANQIPSGHVDWSNAGPNPASAVSAPGSAPNYPGSVNAAPASPAPGSASGSNWAGLDEIVKRTAEREKLRMPMEEQDVVGTSPPIDDSSASSAGSQSVSNTPSYTYSHFGPQGRGAAAPASVNPSASSAQNPSASATPNNAAPGSASGTSMASAARSGSSKPDGNELLITLCGFGILVLIWLGCATGGYFAGKVKGRTVALEEFDRIAALVKEQDRRAEEENDAAKYFSVSSPFDKQSIKARFIRLLANRPRNDEQLQFSVLVEKGWGLQQASDSTSTDERAPQTLAVFSNKNYKDISISVMVRPVTSDVNLEDAFEKYLWKEGFAVLRKTSVSSDRAEAIAREENGAAEQVLVRLSAVKSGDNVFFLACSAPRNDYSRWSDSFTVASLSFSPYEHPANFQPDVPTQVIDQPAQESQ